MWAWVRITASISEASTGNGCQFNSLRCFKPWNKPQSTRIFESPDLISVFDPVTERSHHLISQFVEDVLTDNIGYKITAIQYYQVMGIDTLTWLDGNQNGWYIDSFAQIVLLDAKKYIGKKCIIITFDESFITYDTICYAPKDCDDTTQN